MSKVFVKFPRAGLGNKMIVWARAVVFARKHGLELVASPWWGVRVGPILRNEQKKRLYWGLFKETPFHKLMWTRLQMLFCPVVDDPELNVNASNKKVIYRFSKYNLDNDLFGYVRGHHAIVKEELYSILTDEIKASLDNLDAPVIGVHVRRGDFITADIATPLSFYIDAINTIRSVVGEQWPVTVFTDARKDEVGELLALPAVMLAEKNKDIIDILQLGRSKVLILSKSSSFSYWGAFLSDAVVIRPTGDWQKIIKGQVTGSHYIELTFDDDNKDMFEKSLYKLVEAKRING